MIGSVPEAKKPPRIRAIRAAVLTAVTTPRRGGDGRDNTAPRC
jgi:hypothetical protein